MTKKSNIASTDIPNAVLGALADAFGKSVFTIHRWIANNDDRLTSEKAKKVYKDHNYKPKFLTHHA